MLSKQDLIRMLNLEYNLLKRLTQDLRHKDTLIQPPDGGNCMNWTLGHLLDNQINTLKLLGLESPIDQQELTIYQRESKPITEDGPSVLPLEKLLGYHQIVNDLLINGLGGIDEYAFYREMQHREETVTVGWRFLFLHFHYAFHLGQMDQLVNLASRGKSA